MSSFVVSIPSARDGVYPAFMKWMAAAEPLQTEPDTLRWPMDFYGLPHVFRTSRMKTAGGWKEGGDQELVTPEEDSNCFCNCF